MDKRKWTEYLRVIKKESHRKRNCILFKECLERKVLMDIDPRREDKAIRVHFEKCLLCTLYQEEFILSSVKVMISHTCLIWPTSDYSDLFLNLIWSNPDIYVWKKYETIPAWRGKVDIVPILHGGRKLWWLMCWSIPHWEKSLE